MNLRNIAGATLFALGLCIAAGAEAPDLSNWQVLFQGLIGVVMIIAAIKISN